MVLNLTEVLLPEGVEGAVVAHLGQGGIDPTAEIGIALAHRHGIRAWNKGLAHRHEVTVALGQGQHQGIILAKGVHLPRFKGLQCFWDRFKGLLYGLGATWAKSCC